jgi:hypothetical protein
MLETSVKHFVTNTEFLINSLSDGTMVERVSYLIQATFLFFQKAFRMTSFPLAPL